MGIILGVEIPEEVFIPKDEGYILNKIYPFRSN